MALQYAQPAAVNPRNRQPHVLQPLGVQSLNANSQPQARQSPAIKNFLTRKPQSGGQAIAR